MSGKIALAVFFTFALVLDQVTKLAVQANLAIYEHFEVIPGFFNITYILNPGAAFGIFQNHHPLFRKFFLLAVSFAACIMIFIFLVKEYRYKLRSYAYAAIIAGAAGNAIDRLRLDGVVDFLDFYYGSYHWYTFNIADCYITVGVFVLLFDMLVINKGK